MYTELHARSAFSFLRGSSNPEDLVRRAVELQLPAVALLDRDGVYGAPRFYAPAREHCLRARVGAEITLEDGSVVPLLAATQAGYQNLCQLISEAKLVERAPSLLVARRGSGGTHPLAILNPSRALAPRYIAQSLAPYPRDHPRTPFPT